MREDTRTKDSLDSTFYVEKRTESHKRVYQYLGQIPLDMQEKLKRRRWKPGIVVAVIVTFLMMLLISDVGGYLGMWLFSLYAAIIMLYVMYRAAKSIQPKKPSDVFIGKLYEWSDSFIQLPLKDRRRERIGERFYKLGFETKVEPKLVQKPIMCVKGNYDRMSIVQNKGRGDGSVGIVLERMRRFDTTEEFLLTRKSATIERSFRFDHQCDGVNVYVKEGTKTNERVIKAHLALIIPMQQRGYEVYLHYQAGNVLLYLPEFFPLGDLDNLAYLEETLVRMDLLVSFIEQRGE